MTATASRSTARRDYLRSMWLLSSRDLKVRYSTSALGYLWSILDPLVMSAIYWFVFTVVFHRGGVGEQPYVVFLITALLPWVWFNIVVSDFTTAFRKDSRLVRSTAIPRSIWINRIVLSKGVEFLAALPVLVIFAVLFGVEVSWGLLLFPVAILMQALLLMGLGLIIAPLCVLYSDLERTTRLVLRAAFYGSPIIYGLSDLGAFQTLGSFNPLAGIISLYRTGFFPAQFDAFAVGIAAAEIVFFLVFGLWLFRRLEPTILKEL